MRQKIKRRPGGGGADYLAVVKELYTADHSANPAKPPQVAAICPSCGIEFSRAKRETWRRLCLKCYRWQTARRHSLAAAELLRGVER